MVLLTVTPVIESALERLQEHNRTGLSSAASGQHDDDTALAHGAHDATQLRSNKDDNKNDEVKGEDNFKLLATQETVADDRIPHAAKIGGPISHVQILKLSKELKRINSPPYHLDALLRAAHIYTPPPPPKPTQTSEYRALMARLRREQEEREYHTMTSATSPLPTSAKPRATAADAFASTAQYMDAKDAGDDDAATYADINRQVTLIFNVLVSIIACAAGLWIVGRWWSTPARLALAFGGSIVVAVAEVGIYFGYIHRVKTSIKEEKKLKEVKTVVKTWVIGKGGDEVELDAKGNAVGIEVIDEKKDDEVVRRRNT